MPPEARIESVENITSDIRILRLSAGLDFAAGQYARLSATRVEGRYFSIASAPHESLLEFHIRNTGHGFSAHDFRAGELLGLEGPLGRGVPEHPDRPLLLLAGGIGVAPMRALILDRLHKDAKSEIALYWSVRDKEHLYLDQDFRSLAARHGSFTYVPLTSGTPAPGLRPGFAGEAAAEDLGTFRNRSIYVAGPRAMIDATLPLLAGKGAETGYVFHDAF
jgi:CDP-4-dehydro-6-deoxyglucose reductase/ferredoxin-NAD(P)+ reductase (naphthalene dioxygenase ferredoxin-specific)